MSLSFYEQQELSHLWADLVHLSWREAEDIAHQMLELFDITAVVDFIWEEPSLTGMGNQACTTRNMRTGGLTITFDSLGTDLLTLCHELAHCINDWEAPHHDEVDWDLTSHMLEIAREYL